MAVYRSNKDGGIDDEDDEFFGNQDESDEEHGDAGETTFASSGLALHESRAREERLKTVGYLDAYDANKEILLQEGFEQGYRESFECAVRIGRCLGEASAMAKLIRPKQEQSITNSGTALTDVEDELQRMTEIIHNFSKTFEDTQDPIDVPNLLEKIETDLSSITVNK